MGHVEGRVEGEKKTSQSTMAALLLFLLLGHIIFGINPMSCSSLNHSLIKKKKKKKVQLARMPAMIYWLTSSFIGCLLVL